MLRREFVKRMPAGFGSLPVLSGLLQSVEDRLARLEADLASTPGLAAFWSRVQREFLLAPGLTHLNCGSLGATPTVALDALVDAMRQVEENPAFRTFGWGGQAMDTVREQAAAFLGAGVDEVAITRNTTEGMNAVAQGIDLAPGDQVLTTSHEHGGGMTCWQYLRRHKGVELVYADLPRKVQSADEIVELVSARITPRTRVCSLSHVDTITGLRMPIERIAAITRPRGILLVCDGAQAPGMIPVDVKALGVDTYACSGHKWLLAPKGTGLLYVRRAAQDEVHPAFLHSGYQSYSASGGTRGVHRILALGTTLDFHETVGRSRIEARCRELARHLRGRLEDHPDLELLTPSDPDLSTAMVTFALRRGASGDVIRTLRDEHQVIVKSAQSTYAFCEEEDLPRGSYNALRFSTHIFNDEGEIDGAVDALESVLATA